MKKIIALLLIFASALSLAACSLPFEIRIGDLYIGNEESHSAEATAPAEATMPTIAPDTIAPTEPGEIIEVPTMDFEPNQSLTGITADGVTLDGFFVDYSYVESDGSPLKMVYVFLTFAPSESNYEVDCKYTDLKIGANSYSSDFYKNACMYMPNYYYSSFIEDIYVGNACHLALTFKVPQGDLQPGKSVSLYDSSMPLSGLSFSTNDLISCSSTEQIGQYVDPEGCAQVAAGHVLADDATRDQVRDAINGYYFTFYVSLGTTIATYELEFYAPNEFEVRTPYLNNSGTYEVHNGYIYLHYYTSDDPVEIAYEFKDGDIYLHCAEAFSIYE